MKNSIEPSAESTGKATPPYFIARRVDLYTSIHKALRCALCESLVRVGQLDVSDMVATNLTVLELQSILDFSTLHLRRENELVHAALEARVPASSRHISQEHVEHRSSVDTLREEASQLIRVPMDERPARALGLYRQLALFLAEQCQHMHAEETIINTLLWEHYGDNELREIERLLTANITDAEGLTIARWITLALSPSERMAMIATSSSAASTSSVDAGPLAVARTNAVPSCGLGGCA